MHRLSAIYLSFLFGVVCAAPVFVNQTRAADCLDIVASPALFTGVCTAAWSDLRSLIHPTQKQVGYAWVQYKLDKDFSSAKDAQKEMDKSIVPAVLGPSGLLYITDDHHGLAALDFSGFSKTTVTVNVLCDLRALGEDEFWDVMAQQNLVYLAAHPAGEPDSLPVPIQPNELARTFQFHGTDAAAFSFTDDPWRSMVGFSRKVEQAASPAPSCDVDEGDYKFCERCMYRGCGDDGSQSSGPTVDYFEFRWAYFLNDATLYAPAKWWPTAELHQAFKSAYEHLPHTHAMGDIDTEPWLAAAAQVIGLCRAETTGSYPVPNIFPGHGHLPGYINGYTKLDADPSCDPPECVVRVVGQGHEVVWIK